VVFNNQYDRVWGRGLLMVLAQKIKTYQAL